MTASSVPETNTISFYIDSGASDHLVGNKNLLTAVGTLKKPVHILVAKDKTFIEASLGGKMRLNHSITNGRETTTSVVTLENVLVAEGLHHNLLSVHQIERRGGSLTFKDGKVAK